MYKLYKLSNPGWVKLFTTEQDLTEGLRGHVCDLCFKGYGTDLLSMLASDCGCEYEVEGLTLDHPLTVPEHIQLNYEKNGDPT